MCGSDTVILLYLIYVEIKIKYIPPYRVLILSIVTYPWIRVRDHFSVDKM